MRAPDPLTELLDEARAGEAGAARLRERWLRRQAEESATLVGTLLDLSEQRAVVGVGTRSGRILHGELLAVGTDLVVVRGAGGRDVCVRLAAVATVRPQPGTRQPPASGDRPAALDLGFADVLARLVDDRPRVAIVTGGGGSVAGDLLAVGADVATVRLDGGPPRPLCYVAVTAIDEVAVELGTPP